MRPQNTDNSRSFDAPILDALKVAQTRIAEGRWPDHEQWVRTRELPVELHRGIGPRLVSMEDRGLVESMHQGSSWDGSHRYDVVWRPLMETP